MHEMHAYDLGARLCKSSRDGRYADIYSTSCAHTNLLTNGWPRPDCEPQGATSELGIPPISSRIGAPDNSREYAEQAVVQIFLQNVDITTEEALDWVEKEFGQRICRMTLSRLLLRNRVTRRVSTYLE
jgi:hypothetical protein